MHEQVVEREPEPVLRLYTVGHSTRSLEELVALLHEHAVERLVDVRRYPGSRRNPQFAKSALERALPEHAFEYVHEPDLGGRRAPRKDSPNTAWRNAGFRGYADYMESEGFEAALARVLDAAREKPTALMCAEAHPSRCHRRLIADAAKARGWTVVHIVEARRSEVHDLHPEARVQGGGRIVYSAGSEPSKLRQDQLDFGA